MIPSPEQRAALVDSVVPKALRHQALELVKAMPMGEARTHAFAWVKGRQRSRQQLERFIERMTPSAPYPEMPCGAEKPCQSCVNVGECLVARAARLATDDQPAPDSGSRVRSEES